jgi:hypothetical protein
MTGPDHYCKAEELAAKAHEYLGQGEGQNSAAFWATVAQIHATVIPAETATDVAARVYIKVERDPKRAAALDRRQTMRSRACGRLVGGFPFLMRECPHAIMLSHLANGPTVRCPRGRAGWAPWRPVRWRARQRCRAVAPP